MAEVELLLWRTIAEEEGPAARTTEAAAALQDEAWTSERAAMKKAIGRLRKPRAGRLQGDTIGSQVVVEKYLEGREANGLCKWSWWETVRAGKIGWRQSP